MNENINLLYKVYTDDFIELLQGEEFYDYFINMVGSGKNEIILAQKNIDNKIDHKWIEQIEECIISIDTIIRKPIKFIAQNEEIVPIEQARRITPESIRHLAQHTNMIAKIEGDTVTPNKILNIFREETLETYENRFIYTLLINLQYFIDKRLRALSESKIQSTSKISMKSEFKSGNESINYFMELTSSSQKEMDEALLDVNIDTSKLDDTTRIKRVRQILYEFQGSPMIKELNGCALVRPPIMRTNVLLKNHDFKKALELWMFIETYNESGFKVEESDKNTIPDEDFISQLYSTLVMNYCLLKHHTNSDDEKVSFSERKTLHNPMVIRQSIKEYVNDLTVDIDVVQRVLLDEVRRASKARMENEQKIKTIIERAIASEKLRKQKIVDANKKQIERHKAKEKAEKDRKKKQAALAAEKEKKIKVALAKKKNLEKEKNKKA